MGAPPQQINTRARGHTSLEIDAKPVSVEPVIKPVSMENENVLVDDVKNVENLPNDDGECLMNDNECINNVMVVKTRLSNQNPEISSSPDKTNKDDVPSFSACSQNMSGSRPKAKVKYRVQSASEGKFMLAPANEGPASKKTQQITEKLTKTKTAINTFRALDNSEKLDDNVMKIPSKRKQVFDMGEGTRTLVCIFDKETDNNLTWRGNASESPAKKQKCGHQGSNLSN